MSDLNLTRYEDFWDSEHRESEHGEWVKAEEAEARIKELEAEAKASLTACAHAARIANEHADRIKELEATVEALQGMRDYMAARLRAADELADALEEVDAVYGNFELELTAYREAGK
jgi:outer membrane murein-binding lipoprotein Lpp